jgi:hypothetical protein
MVQFISLSRQRDNSDKLAKSISFIMGDLAPWNLIVVDGNQYDMFSGFNHGAGQAKGEVLVFVHDDVQFLGNPLTMATPLKLLEDPKVGFVGVAGTRLLEAGGCWWGRNVMRDVLASCRGMAWHRAENEFGLHVNVWPPGGGQFGRVLVLDGILLMCHRRTFDRLGGFDDRNYQGFHFYDIDITFRAAQEKLANFAAPIPLLHQSDGPVREGWETNRQVFLRKFGHLLPASIS